LTIIVYPIELKDFENYVSRKALVVFSAPDSCIPCKRLHPHVKALAKELDYPIVYVDVDEAEDIRRQYDVLSVPKVYLFEDGKPTRPIRGRTILLMKTELAAD
jgi:thioredoxin-like negative regulator of GroEL